MKKSGRAAPEFSIVLRPPAMLHSPRVKISGFTFVRNGVALGYPFAASIRSLLPLCDEVIVNVPRSTDGTLQAVHEIRNPKIRVIENEWDDAQRTGGWELSRQTNLALDQCTGDWCVYIQADEALHEDSVQAMRAAMERNLSDQRVQGLLVDYTHFYGSFWTQVYSLGWYYKEVRVIRRSPNIRSVGDAQGFRTIDNRKLRVRSSGGKYFHYGFALEPSQARIKIHNLTTLYGNEKNSHAIANGPARFYDDDQKVRQFNGTHPATMRDIVTAATWTYQSRNPLIRFRNEYFWEDVALILRRCTGITLGVHKNYRLIR
jgi:glycosyltransferase involved in cell wall biosynthesis